MPRSQCQRGLQRALQSMRMRMTVHAPGSSGGPGAAAAAPAGAGPALWSPLAGRRAPPSCSSRAKQTQCASANLCWYSTVDLLPHQQQLSTCTDASRQGNAGWQLSVLAAAKRGSTHLGGQSKPRGVKKGSTASTGPWYSMRLRGGRGVGCVGRFKHDMPSATTTSATGYPSSFSIQRHASAGL